MKWHWVAAPALTLSAVLFANGFIEPLRNLVSSTVLLEIDFYVIFAGALQLAIVLLCVVVLLPLAFTRGLKGYARIIGRLVDFNAALLVTGSLGNVVWVLVARDRMYVAADPLVEYFAFLPYTRSVYDYSWGSFQGHLVGSASDAQLALLWASITMLVWITAYLSVKSRIANSE